MQPQHVKIRRIKKMKTIRTKVYQFSELSNDAKEKAIEHFYDINVSFDWWESVYEDAKNIGLKIKSFDIDRASYCKGEFMLNAYEVSCKIVQEHGATCETHKTALQFGIDWDKLVEKYSDGIDKTKVAEDNEYDFDKEADELEADFLQSICEDYRIMLSKEYDYLTSKEAIIETIEANEYDFTKDGKLFHS